MKRVLLAFVSLIFSSMLWASSNSVYFPGPAQAPNIPGKPFNCRWDHPSGVNNCLILEYRSTIYQPEKNPVEVGFDEAFFSDGVTCNDYGSAPKNKCVNSGAKAPDKGLQVLKSKLEGGILDEKTYPLNDVIGHHHFSANAPNYPLVRIGQGSTVTFEEGTYYFGELIFNEDVTITVKGPIEIHVNRLKLSNFGHFNVDGHSKDVIIWVHQQESGGGNYSATIGSDTLFYGYVYSVGSVKLSGTTEGRTWGTTIYGAVTAKSLVLANRSIIKFGGFLDSHNLKIDPLLASTNTCSRIPVTFKITNDDGETQRDISGKLTASATNFLDTACWATTADGMCNSDPVKTVNLNNGQRKLWLLNKAIGTVNVTASFTSEKTGKLDSEDSSNYTFTAGGFRFKPSKLVAGKPETLSIEAFYGDCDDSTILDYTGEKTLHIGDVRYLQPSSSGAANPIRPEVGVIESNRVKGEQTLKITFDKGVASNAVSVSYDDAGVIALPIRELTNPQSKIKSGIEQSESANERVVGLSGEALLSFRPYTLAICDLIASPEADAAKGQFSKAGEPFLATLRPIIWKKGGVAPSYVVPWEQDQCNPVVYPSTPSFMLSDAPEASVTFSDQAAFNPLGEGSAAVLSGFTEQLHTEDRSGRYVFPELKISDVGSFKLVSRVVNEYLGMQVNRSERPVGRFYPSHFSVSGSLTPAITASKNSGGGGFTYLNQPFDGQYTVNAMTADNKPVKNYHLLGARQKAQFEDWVVNPVSTDPIWGDNLSERWVRSLSSGWQADNNGVSQFVLTGKMKIKKGSEPESPFSPLHFAVGVIEADVDNTQFRFCADQNVEGCEVRVIRPAYGAIGSIAGAEFAQGEFMFGRMRMEGFTDTKTPFSEQILPVAVEVFNGTHFEINTRDNASIVSTAIGQKDVLFSDKAGNPALQAQVVLRDDAKDVISTKSVKQGRADFHVIAPNQSAGLNREQFRYWQQLDKAVSGVVPQTWLQHNWQGRDFDDDPSAIGVFGFYRGSDRVIYKGEKNITLTGE
ncbi:DUF6701 domain-containing protein [Enterovibrio calviensis]|uniref:DUF6701 domain-containing protein n=1 Tax=Enterovibrio calviensis TaxID=91359 RepID=UPI00048083C4|nr:DUF6701 domain-containing protein [Enterovibrio calviensis]